jgi:hypothetical protein
MTAALAGWHQGTMAQFSTTTVRLLYGTAQGQTLVTLA